MEHSLSDKTFGLLLAGMATLFGMGPLVLGKPARPWCLACAIALAAVAALSPARLRKLKTVWLGVTGVFGKALTYVSLGIFFYGVLSPLALVLRLCGRDTLGREYSSGESYWEACHSDRPINENFRQQF